MTTTTSTTNALLPVTTTSTTETSAFDGFPEQLLANPFFHAPDHLVTSYAETESPLMGEKQWDQKLDGAFPYDYQDDGSIQSAAMLEEGEKELSILDNFNSIMPTTTSEEYRQPMSAELSDDVAITDYADPEMIQDTYDRLLLDNFTTNGTANRPDYYDVDNDKTVSVVANEEKVKLAASPEPLFGFQMGVLDFVLMASILLNLILTILVLDLSIMAIVKELKVKKPVPAGPPMRLNNAV